MGTQVYRNNIQKDNWARGYNITIHKDHTLINLTAFLLVEYLVVLKYSSIYFCKIRKCGVLFVNLHL